MKFFQRPIADYKDYYETSKFNLIWNFSSSILLLLVFVTVSNFYNDNYTIIPNLIAIGICLMVLSVLWKTKKYKAVSIIGTLSIFTLISLTFFLQKNVIHYTTPLWMVLNILLAFFMLGKTWGSLLLIGHFVIMFFYFIFNLESNIEGLPPFEKLDISNYIVECAIVGAGILYILRQYIKTTKHAEDEIKSFNLSLIEKNELISIQNKEKEVMLKEIHHRVKNNLQIITSILRLQSYDIKNEQHISTFEEAINRVSSISLIHEKMYQSDLLSNFDMDDYFKTLANNIIASYSFEREIKINSHSSLNNVECKPVVPIALIYNELITNSIKHAFSNIDNPQISVEFESIDNEHIRMIYSDNGIWKENIEDSFGTEMIAAMTEQLEGSYELTKNEAGTTYNFIFKNIDE